jgi:hypothetical protein
VHARTGERERERGGQKRSKTKKKCKKYTHINLKVDTTKVLSNSAGGSSCCSTLHIQDLVLHKGENCLLVSLALILPHGPHHLESRWRSWWCPSSPPPSASRLHVRPGKSANQQEKGAALLDTCCLLLLFKLAAAIDFRLQKYIIRLCTGKQLPLLAREMATRKD